MCKSPTVTVTHQPLPACSSSLRLPPHASASALYPQALSLLLLLPTSLETYCSLRRPPLASMAWGEGQGHSPEWLEFRLELCPFYFCTAVKHDDERRHKQREVWDRWKDQNAHLVIVLWPLSWFALQWRTASFISASFYFHVTASPLVILLWYLKILYIHNTYY